MGALFDPSLGAMHQILVFVCLAIALGFEFVNGFYPETLAILRTMKSSDREIENTPAFRALRGIDPDLIDAVFYFVADNRVIRPDHIYDESELLERWRAALA